MPDPVYQFGDFRLDAEGFKLLRNGLSLRVEPKPMELLILLASRSGRLVSREEIAARLWSSEVFVDTEHGINTAVRKLRHLLRDDPEHPHFIQTVTGKGYRFVATTIAVEDPPSQAPPYEAPPNPALDPLPVATDAEDRDTKAPDAPRARRWIVSAASGLCLVVVLGLALEKHAFFGRIFARFTQPAITSIAVLPLENLSGDPGQEYFADGMTDELITMLAKDSTLRVTSRTSVMQYKGAHRPLPEIARSLGVDAILEGSIRHSGDRVHITLQLIRADSDAHLWAESYDRDVDDGTLPNEAAQAIAKRLHSEVPSVIAARYINPAAHDAYLRGEYLWSGSKMLESKAYFEKATQIQPDYAAAWAGLANYYGEGIAAGVLDPRTNMALEQQAAERALQLDPNLAESHQAMAAVLLIDRWDWIGADREILQAIRLNANLGDSYYLRACILEAEGRFPESIEVEKEAMELDPFERPEALAGMYVEARQFDEALAELQLRMESSPNNQSLLLTLMDTWRRKGNYKEQVAALAKWLTAIGQSQTAVEARRAYDQGGPHGFVRWQLNQRLKQSKKEYVSPVELATYYAQLGDKERTLALLEEGYRQRSTDVLWIQDDPAYDFLHDEPRFQALLQRIGRPAAS